MVRMRHKRRMSTTARWTERATSTGGWCSRLTTSLQSRCWWSRRKNTSTASPRRRSTLPLASRCRSGTTTSSVPMTSLVCAERKREGGEGGEGRRGEGRGEGGRGAGGANVYLSCCCHLFLLTGVAIFRCIFLFSLSPLPYSPLLFPLSLPFSITTSLPLSFFLLLPTPSPLTLTLSLTLLSSFSLFLFSLPLLTPSHPLPFLLPPPLSLLLPRNH